MIFTELLTSFYAKTPSNNSMLPTTTTTKAVLDGTVKAPSSCSNVCGSCSVSRPLKGKSNIDSHGVISSPYFSYSPARPVSKSSSLYKSLSTASVKHECTASFGGSNNAEGKPTISAYNVVHTDKASKASFDCDKTIGQHIPPAAAALRFINYSNGPNVSKHMRQPSFCAAESHLGIKLNCL
jgi:hypothetical protein